MDGSSSVDYSAIPTIPLGSSSVGSGIGLHGLVAALTSDPFVLEKYFDRFILERAIDRLVLVLESSIVRTGAIDRLYWSHRLFVLSYWSHSY